MKKAVLLLLICFIVLSGCDEKDNDSALAETIDAPINIGFATETITVTGSVGDNNIIYKSKEPDSVTFSVSGFENINWYVNTAQNPTGTGNTITLNASGYSIGVHTVSFTGFKNGKIFSDSVLFSVYP